MIVGIYQGYCKVIDGWFSCEMVDLQTYRSRLVRIPRKDSNGRVLRKGSRCLIRAIENKDTITHEVFKFPNTAKFDAAMKERLSDEKDYLKNLMS